MRRPATALVLSMLFVTAGCLGGFQAEPSDPGAEAVVEDAVAAGEAVETYRVQSHLSAAATSDHDRRVLRVTADGAVDRPARKTGVTARQDDVNRTVYVIGNTTYTECAPRWSGWSKEIREELDRDWTGHDPLGRQLTLLDESPVTWAGNETLRGTSVHVVVAHPSDRTLTQFSEDRPALVPLFGPRIENASFRAWIDEESGHVLRTRLTFQVHSDDATVESRMSTTFTDYGASVEIDLPAAATEDPYELGCPGE